MKKIEILWKQYKEIILYLVFGILTTVVNIVSYYIATRFCSFDAYVGNIIAWVVSVLFAFFTNKEYVFESKTLSRNDFIKEMTSFFGFRILSLGIEMLSLYIMLTLQIHDMIAKVIASIIVILLNYVFSKLFIFKSK